jgi:hypothetical protein
MLIGTHLSLVRLATAVVMLDGSEAPVLAQAAFLMAFLDIKYPAAGRTPMLRAAVRKLEAYAAAGGASEAVHALALGFRGVSWLIDALPRAHMHKEIDDYRAMPVLERLAYARRLHLEAKDLV